MHDNVRYIEAVRSFVHTEQRKKSFLPRKYAIFDMDGTVFDTPEVYYQAHKRLAKDINGFDYTKSHQWELMHRPRKPGQSSIDAFLEIIQVRDALGQMQTLEEKRKNIFEKILTNGEVDIVKPGVVEFLHRLRASGILSVLASASSRNSIDRLFSVQSQIRRDLFIAVTGSDEDAEYAVKRDKTGIIQIAIGKLEKYMRQEQKIDPQDCMSFDDAPHGIAAARKAGIGLTIAIPDQYTKRSAFSGSTFSFRDADLIVEGFDYMLHIWRSYLN